MPNRPGHICTQRTTTEALASGVLPEPERRRAEQHLEQCRTCRRCFRQLTEERFPRIRNYTILAELGRGGFGVVYKALHHGKKRTEALKVLFGKSARRAAYFENEVRLVAQLRHPNIATLYEANLGSPPRYYSMEFVEGQHLEDYLRSHDVSLQQRIELVKTVASAIGYAHQQNVVHRDLKPQNILVDPQGQPRIVDFGIAKRLGFHTGVDASGQVAVHSPEGVVGTQGYISPEQLAGQDLDWRTDIYSLGALLFHVITGQPARFAPQIERLAEVLHERHVSRADDLAAIIACCVRPFPEQRYPSCEALVADLDNYLAGRPIRARHDTAPGYRVARVAALVLRNHPLSVQAAVVALVCCLMIGASWLHGAGWFAAPAAPSRTALVAFTPATLAALSGGRIGTDLPGLDPGNKKSFRLLYGRLMEKLAAAQPAVVVWDYFFPDCQPEFDPAFIEGVRQLAAPVIVGAKRFDRNAEPDMCAAIRQAVHGWGSLQATRPEPDQESVFVPLAVQRGLNPPVPSLALAAFAAARHPDCTPDIQVTRGGLELRYRKRTIGPDELRFPYPCDTVPIIRTATAGPPDGKHGGLPQVQALEAGDTCLFGGFRLRKLPDWVRQPLSMEQVLAGDPAWLRARLGGCAVVVGQMVPPIDQHVIQTGETAFGCQIQALVLDDLLTGAVSRRLSHVGLVTLVCGAALFGAVAVALLPTRPTWPLRALLCAGATLVLSAAGLAVWLSTRPSTAWAIQGGLALCAVLTAGGAVLIVKLLHQRQLYLTPRVIWSAGGSTASTTLLAASPRDASAPQW